MSLQATPTYWPDSNGRMVLDGYFIYGNGEQLKWVPIQAVKLVGVAGVKREKLRDYDDEMEPGHI